MAASVVSPPRKIVVVDDDGANAELLRMLLEMDGHTVLTVESVKSALEAITADVSAFIIDYHLIGQHTGMRLLEAIRAGETPAASNAVVLITSGDMRWREAVLLAGADDFLLKPFRPRHLSTTLNNLLSRD